MANIPFRVSISLSILALCNILAHVKAQNLPGIQNLSIPLPATIKIDGKASEWNDVFSAYNKTAEIYYTIANDDYNLYMIIQSDNPGITSKILRGGITFTVRDSWDKKDNSEVSITFPAPVKEGMRSLFGLANNYRVVGNKYFHNSRALRSKDSQMLL